MQYTYQIKALQRSAYNHYSLSAPELVEGLTPHSSLRSSGESR